MILDGNFWFSFCSPFLKIEITSATFNESGYTPSFRQKLKRSLTNLHITGFAYLINLVSMSDVLVAFLFSILQFHCTLLAYYMEKEISSCSLCLMIRHSCLNKIYSSFLVLLNQPLIPPYSDFSVVLFQKHKSTLIFSNFTTFHSNKLKNIFANFCEWFGPLAENHKNFAKIDKIFTKQKMFVQIFLNLFVLRKHSIPNLPIFFSTSVLLRSLFLRIA